MVGGTSGASPHSACLTSSALQVAGRERVRNLMVTRLWWLVKCMTNFDTQPSVLVNLIDMAIQVLHVRLSSRWAQNFGRKCGAAILIAWSPCMGISAVFQCLQSTILTINIEGLMCMQAWNSLILKLWSSAQSWREQSFSSSKDMSSSSWDEAHAF